MGGRASENGGKAEHVHLASVALRDLPLSLARVHLRLGPGDIVSLRFPCRRLTQERVCGLLEGAGFEPIERGRGARKGTVVARRARSLPDLVAPRLRLLVCGLNPSPYSADRGIPFARPGNRFWPAALAAGLVRRDRDVFAALRCGIGFTDLVKRPTPGSNELSAREYAAGAQRVEDLVRVHRPRAICFVGLDGWRRAVDRAAVPGWVRGGFGGRPAYLMPSTSGRNARIGLRDLSAHLVRAANPPAGRR